tara:strand:- start:4567 stop:5154 length:588 start_codon:yes stop_codon:yes gene_type:complete
MENIYKKMKGLLGMTEELSEETKMMAEAYLVDGTTIKTESDRFEEGSMVFVVGEDDERMALPSGTYELQDGAVIEVVDGEITTLRSPEASEDAVEEDLSSEKEETEEKVETPEIDLSSYMTKEDGFELGKMITEAIDLKIADLISAHNTELEKVKKLSATKTFKNTPKSQPKTEVKTELSTDDRVFAIFNKIKNK